MWISESFKIPQKNIGHLIPIQKLKEWSKKEPEVFKKEVYNLSRLDMPLVNSIAEMKIAFRVDASLEIGSGHLMRCLTLADALRAEGASCYFICREHPGNFLELVRQHRFGLIMLPVGPTDFQPNIDHGEALPVHAPWLGCDWQTDAEQTRSAIETLKLDWLVVDHYAIDARWEQAQEGVYQRLMVVDDLADRPHACDLLLDQTFGRTKEAYKPWGLVHCTLLTGSKYALLRPEFTALRKYSLKRREQPKLKRLLITMGGVDQHNATGCVLNALKDCQLPKDCLITVVMGAQTPWFDNVSQQVAAMPWSIDIKVNISGMAQLMADADLSIGAAGSTSWERCCLGLPSLMAVLADNQRGIAAALDNAGASRNMGAPQAACFREKISRAISDFGKDTALLKTMSLSAAHVTDGCGTQFVLAKMLEGRFR